MGVGFPVPIEIVVLKFGAIFLQAAPYGFTCKT